MKIAVYIHVYTVNNWALILQEIISAIVHSGLYERCKYVKICMQGVFDPQILTYIVGKYGKIHTHNTGEENNYEWDTLQLLWKERNSYDYVLYLHSKNVSSPDIYNITMHNWRRFMLWVNVRHFNEHLIALSRGSTVSGTLHFINKMMAGNFWWSTRIYISKLMEPLKYKQFTKEKHKTLFAKAFMAKHPVEFIEENRWGCEVWICDNPTRKVNSIRNGDPKTFKEWDK